jgi:hypothetical protein
MKAPNLFGGGTKDGRITSMDSGNFVAGCDMPRVNSMPRYTAYLKIAEGCDNTCAFCIIPKLRGKQRSRPIEDLVREARRLVDWYLGKTDAEVTKHLARERAFKPMMPREQGGGSPDAQAIRVARANLKPHMKYTNWLAGTRDWLAGDTMSYADLAAAGSLSVLDYLGEIDWSDYPAARDWYVRIKSRPSFRPLLADRISGLPPVSHYADLDF